MKRFVFVFLGGMTALLVNGCKTSTSDSTALVARGTRPEGAPTGPIRGEQMVVSFDRSGGSREVPNCQLRTDVWDSGGGEHLGWNYQVGNKITELREPISSEFPGNSIFVFSIACLELAPQEQVSIRFHNGSGKEYWQARVPSSGDGILSLSGVSFKWRGSAGFMKFTE